MQVKAALFGALAYFVLPFDAMPDVMPMLGFADDAAVLATALRHGGEPPAAGASRGREGACWSAGSRRVARRFAVAFSDGALYLKSIRRITFPITLRSAIALRAAGVCASG